jgi:serine/threonine-protein kinase RsbW
MSESLSVPADMEQLPRVFQWTDDVADRAALPDWTRYALLLCIEEAVSNVIRYGYPPDHRDIAHDQVHLTLAWDGEAATLTIEDQGVPFDPRDLAEPAQPKTVEDAQIGGLGIHLMRRYAESMDYQRDKEFNRLTLRIRRNNVEAR